MGNHSSYSDPIKGEEALTSPRVRIAVVLADRPRPMWRSLKRVLRSKKMSD